MNMKIRKSSGKDSNSLISTSAGKGAVHKVPKDLIKHLSISPVAVSAWNDITPLARNEWVCWVISAKKAETRAGRIEKARSMLEGGKRRPCCWEGCGHRKDKK